MSKHGSKNDDNDHNDDHNDDHNRTSISSVNTSSTPNVRTSNEQWSGSDYDDDHHGSSGHDRLAGGTGSDHLYGDDGNYQSTQPVLEGVKDGVLLELGFDDTTPNVPLTISSWAWEAANNSVVKIIDNRAKDVHCYAATHTFVEKLQTISTKYRH